MYNITTAVSDYLQYLRGSKIYIATEKQVDQDIYKASIEGFSQVETKIEFFYRDLREDQNSKDMERVIDQLVLDYKAAGFDIHYEDVLVGIDREEMSVIFNIYIDWKA